MSRRLWALVVAGAVVVAACGGSSSATPSGSVDGEALARDFVAILTDPALRATLVQQTTATATGGGDSLELRATIGGDVALPDVALQVAIEAEGELTRFAIVVAGDRSFVDLGEGWVEAPPGSVDTSELTDALVVVEDPDDLRYAGTQEVDGRTLYHLVATGPLPYSSGGLPGTGDGTGTIDGLDAYVEADGTPVQISLSFTTSGTDAAGTTTSLLGTTEIRFADVGGDQAIAVPSLAPTASPSPAP